LLYPLAAVALTLASAGSGLPPLLRELDPNFPNLNPPRPDVLARDAQERQIVALMADHAAETRWVYTDRPMFAFAAGLPVPPYLAVLSSKRLETGALTEEAIRAVLEEYKPELVFAARFEVDAVEDYMRRRNFIRIDSSPRYRLYLRRDPP
jgi:hypothetical protein